MMIADSVLQVGKISLFASLLIILLLILTPLLQKRYQARWRCFAWLVIALRLLVPMCITFPQAPIQIELPSGPAVAVVTPPSEERSYAQVDWGDAITPVPNANGSPANVAPPDAIAIEPLTIAGGVWLAGMLGFLLFQIVSYHVFLRRLKNAPALETPQQVKETLWQTGVDMGVCRLPEAVVTDVIDAPVLIGVLRPRVLLPHTNYSDEEIAFILRHELVHYSRRDMWYKLVLLLANAVHWFNPLAYLMTLQAAKDIELACDDDVARKLDRETRARYGDTILAALPQKRRLDPLFSTHFGSAKQNMKKRLRNLFDMAVKRRGIASLCAFALCAVAVTGIATVGFASETAPSHTPIKNSMIHANDTSGKWAAASSIEGSTWQKQMDEEIKWLESTYREHNTRFVITETLPKSEAYNISRIQHLYDNSEVFRAMSEMQNGVFQVEDGKSFSGFSDFHNAEMIHRTVVMLESDGDLTVDVNYALTHGKMELWLVNPSGKRVYRNDMAASFSESISVAGAKGLWSVIAIRESEENASVSGNVAITLRQPQGEKVWNSTGDEGFKVERLGQAVFQSGGALSAELTWDGDGYPMLLYTDRDYNDDEILLPLQGLPGIPKPDESKVDRNKMGSVFNFSQSPNSPLTWNTNPNPGTYYFYLIHFGNTGKVSGSIRATNGGITKDLMPGATGPEASGSRVAFQLSGSGRSITQSGNFAAGAGQKLTIAVTSSIRGGAVDLFLFSPSGKERRYTFSGRNTTETLELTAGTWAYNCTGFFDSGEISITGTRTLGEVNSAGTHSPESGTEKYDAEGIRIMENTGTWGDSINRLLPNMSPDAVEKVVDIYLERHLFPGITTSQGARQVYSTIEPALPYMTKEAGESAARKISAYY